MLHNEFNSKKYYSWDPEFFNLEYDLDTDFSELVKNTNLEQRFNEESKEIEFKGKNGIPERITLKDNKVNSIWLSTRLELPHNNKMFDLPINELLTKLDNTLTSLNDEISSIDDLKKYNKSNVLHLVFRDYFISYIGIIKRTG